jgi:NADH-quinone oxidoreductase subunit A
LIDPARDPRAMRLRGESSKYPVAQWPCRAAAGLPDTGVPRQPMVLSEYLPILLFLGVATVMGVVLLGLGTVLGPRRPGAEKQSPYECGFEAFEDARMKFDVRYYLVAILFIIFDLEIAFLFPWALVFTSVGWQAFASMGLFLGVLVIGFVYVWKKGALEWE